MKRIALVLATLWPIAAAADWAPQPSLFGYEATFATCTADIAATDPTPACAERISEAYALKRAVALAAYACGDTPLTDCPSPFEDQGLPAIAARIAADIGCDGTPIAALPATMPLPPDHCAVITADIMIDEGVMPLITEIECNDPVSECSELAMVHATLWIEAADALAGDDPTIDDLQARNVNDCLAAVTTSGVQAQLDAMACLATRSAALWADLAQRD